MGKPTEVIEDIDLLLENSTLESSNLFESEDGVKINPSASEMDNIHLEDTFKQIQSQVVDISKIYYQQNKGVQKQVREHLISNLKGDYNHTTTVTGVFFQIGAMSELVGYFIAEHDSSTIASTTSYLHRLNYLLYYCWESFTKSDIKKLRTWCRDSLNKETNIGKKFLVPGSLHARRLLRAIAAQTNKILVQDVRQRIEVGFNPEINEDEAKIKEEFSKFGFPPDLSEALDKIDQQLSASKDAFDFKGTMDLLRSFTERFYESILDQYGDKGEAVHEQDSEAVAKFFVKQGLVNEDFGKMIASQRHFISNTASHRLKSREEDARLSKNMVIEMSLYIMRRLQNN